MCLSIKSRRLNKCLHGKRYYMFVCVALALPPYAGITLIKPRLALRIMKITELTVSAHEMKLQTAHI